MRFWPLMAAACALFPAYVLAGDEERLSKLMTNDREIVIGVIEESSPSLITIRDIKSDETREVPRSSVRYFRENISDQEAIRSLGVAEVVAWRMGPHLPKGRDPGHVVSVNQSTIYVNLGSTAGSHEGQTLEVFRVGEELVDPVTGEVLGKEKRKVATLKVFEVAEKFSKARREGELEIELKPGDMVVPSGNGSQIAVFPLTNEDGQVTKGGLSIAESLTSELVANGAGVVERTKLLTVIAEQAIGQILDSKEAEKVAKGLGASAIVVGTVVDGQSRSNINVRLVEVSTGKILYAATFSSSSLSNEPVSIRSIAGGGSATDGEMPKETSSESNGISDEEARFWAGRWKHIDVKGTVTEYLIFSGNLECRMTHNSNVTGTCEKVGQVILITWSNGVRHIARRVRAGKYKLLVFEPGTNLHDRPDHIRFLVR